MSVCVIINPNAGSAEGGTELLSLIESQADVVAWTTSEAGDARTLARRAANEGFDIVAAAGGDGTVHAVVNGLMEADRRAHFGLLPLGTGNDLARTLMIPRNPLDAFALLLAGKTERLDLIRVEAEGAHRYVINAAAGGFSGQVDEVLTSDLKNSWGPLAYLFGAASVLPDLTNFHTMFYFDDEEGVEEHVVNVIVANGRTVGGGKRVAPIADPRDGLMDVVLVKDCGVVGMAAIATKLLAGNYLTDPNVLIKRVRSLRVVSDPGMWFNVDGELLTREPISFTIEPSALDTVVSVDFKLLESEPLMEEG